MIIGFFVFCLVSMFFVGIGIVAWKSAKPAGFFAGCEAPGIPEENVKKYNHGVAIIWFVAAFFIGLAGIPFLFAEQNAPIYIVIILCAPVLVIGMAVAYIQIEAKYKKI